MTARRPAVTMPPSFVLSGASAARTGATAGTRRESRPTLWGGAWGSRAGRSYFLKIVCARVWNSSIHIFTPPLYLKNIYKFQTGRPGPGSACRHTSNTIHTREEDACVRRFSIVYRVRARCRSAPADLSPQPSATARLEGLRSRAPSSARLICTTGNRFPVAPHLAAREAIDSADSAATPL